jgi:G3E family GTPase
VENPSSIFRGDFLGILKTLVDNRTRFDYIVIETDGLTDPSFMKVFYDIVIIETQRI